MRSSAAPRSTPRSSATAPPPTATTWSPRAAKARSAASQQALATVDAPIDYLNTHGTSTPVGDVAEIRGVREVFGDKAPAISSTKSLSGHSLGAAGIHEAIYCLLMMEGGFIAGSANIDELDPEVADLPILRETRENAKLDTVMSNSFGFGGTNATLVLKRWQG